IINCFVAAVTGVLLAAQIRAANPPTISSQPQSQTLDPGQTVRLTVQADGVISGFKWMLNGDYIDEGALDLQHVTIVSGAQSSTLTILNAQPADGGSYSAMAYNESGSVESHPASIVVRAAALPFSDYFSQAGTITSSSGVGSGDSSRATRESGEP